MILKKSKLEFRKKTWLASIVILKKSKLEFRKKTWLALGALHTQVGKLGCESHSVFLYKAELQGVLYCWARVSVGHISNSKAPKCVCARACTHAFAVTKIPQDFVHEPSVDQVWGCPVHSRHAISDGVVWFSELTSLSKATSLVPLETGYMAR